MQEDIKEREDGQKEASLDALMHLDKNKAKQTKARSKIATETRELRRQRSAGLIRAFVRRTDGKWLVRRTRRSDWEEWNGE